MEQLERLDHDLMVWLNGLHADFLDPIMVVISGKLTWIPVYGLLLFFVIKKYGWKTGLMLAGLQGVVVVVADAGSVHLFKEVFQRYRPCQHETLRQVLHVVDDCSGQYGFISSHAANHFAISVFMALILRKPHVKWLLIWAAVVAYSRIYLGVHYPSDIAAGAIWGSSMAVIVYLAIGRKLAKQ